MTRRWSIAILITAAIAISYLDRLTLPVAIGAIRQDIPISDQTFAQSQRRLSRRLRPHVHGRRASWSTRSARAAASSWIMVFWSLACASHGLAMGFWMLAISRFLLGLGEGGGFPAATKAVAEWFPVRERSSAMGLINAGTAVGSVIAPPLIAAIILNLGWRWVFFLTGGVGLVWTVWWLLGLFPAQRASADLPRRARRNRDAKRRRRRRAGDAVRSWTSLLRHARRVGTGDRQISQRRRVVLLQLLAAEVPARRPPVQHQGSRRLRLDSLRRLGHRQPHRRRVLELAAPPRLLAERCPARSRSARAPP